MKKCLLIFIILFFSSIVNSCAIQTSVIKSMHDAKKSILKIETWARMGECNEKDMTCPKYELLSMGSGAIVLYDNKKTVLTAAHVCKQMKFELFLQKEKGDFYLKAIDRNDKEYIIKIIKYDTVTDLCLLESTSGPFEAGYIRISTKKPEYGELTYNLAGPMGIIDGEMVPIYEGRFFGNSKGSAFYSTPAIGGSSGSAILNSKGELVGMIHSVHFRFHHVALSATYEQLWNFLTIVRNHTLEFLN